MNEGIHISPTKTGLSVDVVRHDSTRIDFYGAISEMLEDFHDTDVLVIADKKVLDLYSHKLAPILRDRHVVVIQVSEKEKSWSNLEEILNHAIVSQVSRRGAVVALGGGVITDMAGLAANLYFRGIRSVLIPTTLLAMVDAAVGGKVAVNHPHQKNLLGSFYHPTRVLMAMEFLKTIDDRHMYSAAGEIFKLALLSDTNLFERVQAAPTNWIRDQDYLKEIVALSAAEKLRMLGANCFERDLRRPLNLGHSVGHPIEDITDFRVLHGEAVSYGLLIACHISLQRKMLSQESFDQIYQTAKKFGCTVNVSEYDKDELWSRMRRLIAQRGGKGLLYVLPTAIGSAEIVRDITRDELFGAIKRLNLLSAQPLAQIAQ